MNKICFFVFSTVCVAVITCARADSLNDELTGNPQFETNNSALITTNLVIFLSSAKYDLFPATSFKSDELISLGILGTSTNIIGYRHFPSFPAGGNFDCHLFDQSGNEVQKTKAGLELATPPRKPTGLEITLAKKFPAATVDKSGGEFLSMFRPEDMFLMTNKGTYKLEIQVRLCVIMKNGLPDLKAMTDWRNVSTRGYPFASDFGILNSPILRIRIIKE